MNAKELKSEGLKRVFEVTVKNSDFEDKIDAKIQNLSKTTKIPGFRPGKAPKAMLMQKFRPAVLGETLDEVINSAANEVLTKNKMTPAMTPDIKMGKFEEGKDIKFEMSFEVLPEIKFGDLNAIKLEKSVAEVPAEEIEKTLKYLAQSRRTAVKVKEDRAAQKGDTVVINFVGSVDGVEFKGGKGDNYPLELGSGAFIPGFEDQLIGKKSGDKVDVKVKFPENYHAKDLAGKDAVFAVEIKELREPKEVEINDEFAKSMGEENLNRLKEAIKTRIKTDYEAASRMKLKRQLLDNLDKEYKFDVPQGLVDAEYKAIVDQYNNAKKYNQLDEEEKAKPEEKLLQEYKEIAVRRVKLGLLLSEIGKSAKINITPDDINKAIMNEARKYPGQEKAVFDFYLKNRQAVESLKAPVFEEKIVDYIFEKATITEKTVSLEELYNFNENDSKPAKKKVAAKSEDKAESKAKTSAKSTKEKTVKATKKSA
ncbi:MAG: trigger factor [Alphaproteobacteria bacterium]|nr:trigger factor [Alphaproteobacteria bacterium]